MTDMDKRQWIHNWCAKYTCSACPLNNTPLEDELCCAYTENNAPESIIDKWFVALGGVEPTEVTELSEVIEETTPLDNVNHPSHYETGKVECIDAMIETQGIDAVKSFCICNAFKYIWRHQNKNQLEDVKKAIWYLNKFVELEESNGRLECVSL